MIAENDSCGGIPKRIWNSKGRLHAVPPTNKKINIRSADLYRIEDGIITGHRDMVDQLNLLKQTGILLSENANKEFKDTKVVWIPEYEESEVK